MSKSCGVEEESWRIGTIVCGGIGIGWGILVTICAIVLMALAGTQGAIICDQIFLELNETAWINQDISNFESDTNFTIPINNPFTSYDTCKASVFLVFIIIGVSVFIVALLFWIIPGSLAVCGAQNKSTGLVCAYIVCLVLLLVIDVAGIIGSFVMSNSPEQEYLYTYKESLIISAVGIVLTVLAIVVAGNYRNAVKQDENTVALI